MPATTRGRRRSRNNRSRAFDLAAAIREKTTEPFRLEEGKGIAARALADTTRRLLFLRRRRLETTKSITIPSRIVFLLSLRFLLINLLRRDKYKRRSRDSSRDSSKETAASGRSSKESGKKFDDDWKKGGKDTHSPSVHAKFHDPDDDVRGENGERTSCTWPIDEMFSVDSKRRKVSSKVISSLSAIFLLSSDF